MIWKYLTFRFSKCIISAAIMVKKQFQLNPYFLLIVSFLGITLIGSFLLSMPFAFRNNPNHEWCHVGNYLDAFFTSLASMSLTGFVTYPEGLANTLSLAGQIIVLVLMQIGGLGAVTILTFLFTTFKRKLQFKDRLFISQAIAFNDFSEIARFVRRMMMISVVCELLGFALGIPVFIQVFPDNILKGLYFSLFHSVSAFNNVGFTLFSANEGLLEGISAAGGVFFDAHHWLYYYLTFYMAGLSLIGGVSFLVIIDVVFGRKPPRRWSVVTKICLSMTIIMIIFFAICLYLTDGLKKDNPMNTYEALMQVINCRTAGFTMYPQSEISLPGRMICCVVMFIGGSPLSTAGGIKLTTLFVIVLSIISYFRGKRTAVFKRYYSESMTAKSLSLVFIVLFNIVLAFIALNLFGLKETAEPLNDKIQDELITYYLYEVFSAFSNVGFYTGLESHLSTGSLIVLCLLMLLGHLGPMTFFQLFQNHLDKKANVHYSFVEEDFLIG